MPFFFVEILKMNGKKKAGGGVYTSSRIVAPRIFNERRISFATFFENFQN